MSSPPSVSSPTQVTSSPDASASPPAASSAAAAAAAAAAASAHDDNKEDEKYIWYFAIGSMMNPVSMSLRNLVPRQSHPALLRGWGLRFRGGGGMADIDPSASESFHGVLHLLSASDFLALDQIEGWYRRTPVTAELYDGTKVDAFAYKMDSSRLSPSVPDALPGERYLDIIIRGAVHHGVDKEYIEWLKQVKVLPRKKPEEFRRIPDPPADVEMDMKTLAQSVGDVPGFPVRVAYNYKVLEWVGPADLPAEGTVASPTQMAYEWAKKRQAGKDMTVEICKMLYEPLFPLPDKIENMPPEQREWAEELFVGMAMRAGPSTGPDMVGPNWKVVARLNTSSA